MGILETAQALVMPKLERFEGLLEGVQKDIADLKTDYNSLNNRYSTLSNDVSELKGKYENAHLVIMAQLRSEFMKDTTKLPPPDHQ